MWEFYSHFRDDQYIRKLIEDHKFWYLSASKECRKSAFKKVKISDLETFDNKIKEFLRKFAQNPVTVERLIGDKLEGFSEVMDKMLRSSKFSYQDSIVFVSAIYTKSHIIMTLDDTFSSGTHLKELKEARRDIPQIGFIQFKKPENFSSESHVKTEYEIWFKKQNNKKLVGSIYKYYPRRKVICVKCLNNYSLKVRDYIYVVKFDTVTRDIFYKLFQIKSKGLRDAKTNGIIGEGNNVTIKLPDDFFSNKQNPKNSMIFIAE